MDGAYPALTMPEISLNVRSPRCLNLPAIISSAVAMRAFAAAMALWVSSDGKMPVSVSAMLSLPLIYVYTVGL